MSLRLSIELRIVLHEIDREGNNLSSSYTSPSRSDQLKSELNDELENVGGFQNWRQSVIAEALLDDTSANLVSVDGENRYLLEGYEGDNFVHIIIDWEQGKQPIIHRVEIENIHRRVK